MAKQLFANNASSILAASISDSDLTIQVDVGYGALFPNPGADEFFAVTLENDDGDIEIVYCSSRSTDLLTVSARGQEGTVAQAWTNGQARVECRVTKATLDGFLQLSGGEMSGDIDMNDNEIAAARLTGDWVGEGGQLVGTVLRGTEDDASNEIEVPAGGGRATAGGAALLTEDDDLSEVVFAPGMLMLWYGAAINVPTGWAICNGSNGTPDLRNRFVVGAGDTYALDAQGGAVSNTPTMDSQGGHTHGGTVAPTVLTEDNMPQHSHRIYARSSSALAGNSRGFSYAQTAGVEGQTVEDSRTFGYQTTAPQSGGNPIIEAAGTGDPEGHTHGLDMDSAGSHSHTISAVPTLPPYKAIYYIMFIGS